MEEEMTSLEKNQTQILVDCPKGQSIVGCRWLFKRKEGAKGVQSARFKARLVTHGFTQKERVDFVGIFSPLVKHNSIRVLLAMVAHFHMELEQMDVKTTFLHGKLDQTIYMKQPTSFFQKG